MIYQTYFIYSVLMSAPFMHLLKQKKKIHLYKCVESVLQAKWEIMESTA